MRITDAVGTEIEPGDTVIYRKTKGLGKATVSEIVIREKGRVTIKIEPVTGPPITRPGGYTYYPYSQKQRAIPASIIKVS